jgi:hypothetical protein
MNLRFSGSNQESARQEWENVIRSFTIVAVACGLLLLVSGSARAQGPYVRPQISPYSRPALSPYLNLFRGGNPAINYYGLVRPQEEFNSSIQELHNELHATQTGMVNPTMSTNLPVTGHPTRFFSQGAYFFTHLGSGSRTSGTPTPGVVSARPGTPASMPR